MPPGLPDPGDFVPLLRISVVLMGGGSCLPGNGFGTVGVSFTMGEYCEMEEAPLKAPGGGAARRDGAWARLP